MCSSDLSPLRVTLGARGTGERIVRSMPVVRYFGQIGAGLGLVVDSFGMLAVCRDRGSAALELDLSRVHFVGRLAYTDFVQMLQLSRIHVYLTYPFVLSWSMIEAMSAGCIVVGSATGPVQEVITHGENGLLVDFFSGKQLVDGVCRALDGGADIAAMRRRARETAVERYDVHRCLQAQWQLLSSLARGRAAPPPGT